VRCGGGIKLIRHAASPWYLAMNGTHLMEVPDAPQDGVRERKAANNLVRNWLLRPNPNSRLARPNVPKRVHVSWTRSARSRVPVSRIGGGEGAAKSFDTTNVAEVAEKGAEATFRHVHGREG
jgi:hypothetical protein